MTSEFTPEKIKKVAMLAKIKLTEDEINIFNEQFSSISKVIQKLRQVDTTDITPVNNPSQASTLLREDIVNDGGYADDIIRNAPKHSYNCFVVPKVIE